MRAGWALSFPILPLMLAAQTNAPDPEPVRTSITVLERIETEAPSFVTTLGRRLIAQQPGVNLDDRLRAIPGFTLFRRASSLVANPTTQGVSLRGLGSSGASRTLVLWDGVPINDPFGGWVYWTRVSPDEIDRIEVSRGASTSVFGDRAMSGAIAMFSRSPEPHMRIAYDGGNLDTHQVNAGGGMVWNRFGASANLRAFTTDGYFTVLPERRGAADARANVQFLAGNTRLDWLGGADRLFVRLDILAEERENGTVLTRNSTSLGTIAANYSHQWTNDTVSVLAYHTREMYRATFSAVTANRNVETLTSLQSVPSEAVGAAGVWRRRGNDWNLIGGADMQRVEGTSRDIAAATGVLRPNGGSQFQQGTFVQTDFTRGWLRSFLGARYQAAAGGGNRFFSPNAGLTAGRGPLRARGSVFRAFRAPTLNELFRPFRVGNAETLANPNLRPETLFGAEAGVDYFGEHSTIAVSVYRNSLDDLITNVTLSQSGNAITRQRQNAVAALTRGVDMNARFRWNRWSGELGYLLADSKFASGQRIPQIPRHTGTAQVTWFDGSTFASAGVRAFSLQYEDDLNQFVLPGFTTVQLAVSRKLAQGVSVNGEVENLLNRQFLVGFTPVPLVGAPRLWRIGIRWDFPRSRPAALSSGGA